MKHTYALAALLLASLVWGQETPDGLPPKLDAPAKSPITLEQIENPPERKISATTSESPVSIITAEKDIHKDKKEYLAVMKFASNGTTITHDLQKILPLSEPSFRRENGFENEHDYISYMIRASAIKEGKKLNVSSLVEQLPELMRKELESRSFKLRLFFVSEPASQYEEDKNKYVICAFLGESSAEAEKNARDFLRLLDWGYFRPRKLSAFRDRESHFKKWFDLDNKLKQDSDSFGKINAELNQLSDLSVSMLPDLRVHRIKIDVDIAGLKAMIAKSEEIAQPSKLLTDSLVNSRIELTGLLARKEKLDEYITKIQKKEQLSTRRAELTKKTRLLRDEQAQSKGSILSDDFSMTFFSQPTLKDDKITIYPVNRIPPKESPTPPGGGRVPRQTPLGKTGNPG